MAKLINRLIKTAIVGIMDTGMGIGQISHNTSMQLSARSMCADVL